ncbi:MAG: oxygen-independent coproporphyrinogen III oxidase-like protein [Burkholderiales bacterium]|nr:oxygen-independent coproporphyrinogen III oxidase-like protein [Burkholderiales bacterium]
MTGSAINHVPNQSSTLCLTQLPSLSLYIHIPWCVKKCPYCDFNSHKLNNNLPEESYIKALIADLEQALPLIWGRAIRTIFIGGGTPSLFSGDGINQILSAVRSHTRLLPFAEITLEANPGTLDNEHLADYYMAGVNRISLGIQSFNDKHLQSLGRIHDGSVAIAAINLAKKYFTRLNLDIIYGLPNQTAAQAMQDIATACEFNPSHLSCYNLTIEPNTQFAAKPPTGLPDNDLCYIMQDQLINLLQQRGFRRYETSAFAHNSDYCAHNLNYWQFGDYLGIGAGAHSKLSFHDKIIRQVRQKHPTTYMNNVTNSSHIVEDQIIAAAELPFEFMLNALRLIDGVKSSLFVERTGLSLSTILSQMEIAKQKGLLNFNDGKIVPTKLGQDFLNDLLMLFLSSSK